MLYSLFYKNLKAAVNELPVSSSNVSGRCVSITWLAVQNDTCLSAVTESMSCRRLKPGLLHGGDTSKWLPVWVEVL